MLSERDRFKDIENAVLEKIRPDARAREKIVSTINVLTKKLKEAIAKHKSGAEVILVGSCARDTFMKDSKDIDLFILFPENLPREKLENEGIKLGMEVLNGELRYAEHPYVHGYYNGFEVDIVPCYKVKDPSKKLSAVDRTPFHNQYVTQHLKEEQKDQVRLLKQFLKGIGIYGAEASVQGFSGYLCELLIIKYGSFHRLLENATTWRANIHMWLEKEPVKKFPEPLVFIDPVDINRNVASAVSLDSLSIFIVSAKRYLENPDIKFFFPENKDVPVREARKFIRNYLGETGTAIIIVTAPHPGKVEDIVFPQLKKMERVIVQNLSMAGFRVLRSSSFSSDARKKLVVVLEIESLTIPALYLHSGPYVWLNNAREFLAKYAEGKNVIVPPYISGGRWVVGLKKTETHAIEYLKNRVATWNLGKDISNMGIEVQGLEGVSTKEEANFILKFLKPPLPGS
ncbi:MAG: CCA tRNA nucleotidyltransferase [Thermoplasmata archaeon]